MAVLKPDLSKLFDTIFSDVAYLINFHLFSRWSYPVRIKGKHGRKVGDESTLPNEICRVTDGDCGNIENDDQCKEMLTAE